MGLVRLMQAGSAQSLASALRQVPGGCAPDQAPPQFAEAVAGGSTCPGADAHVAAAKQLDSCLEDFRTRSSRGAASVLAPHSLRCG